MSAAAPQLQQTVQLTAPAGKPTAVGDGNSALLQLLLQVERDARRAKSVAELGFLMANETRRVIGARQVFILARREKRLHTVAVSSVSSLNRNTPLIAWIEKEASALFDRGSAASSNRWRLDRNRDEGSSCGDFPFTEAVGTAIGGSNLLGLGVLIAVREQPFADAEALALQRLAETFGHAWDALERPPRRRELMAQKNKIAAGLAVCGLIAGFIPVPLTALAPAEVVPLAPAIIAAPIDGAIETVDVEPNQVVKAGDVLFRYLDTQSRGALDVAAREVGVAEARLRQVSQLAFVDPSAKRELAVARSELRLRRAEQAFAAEVHERTIVRSPRNGIAVYPDKRELIGRPINTGIRVMEIADPASTQFRLQVMADDSLVLKEGSKVRLFMDEDPLRPLTATLKRIAPMAKPNEAGTLTFKAEAEIADGGRMPGLGHRGTGQIVGEQVSLAFYLFRRPVAALRQRIGL